MAQLTGISNDTIQSSENVLLTFRNLGHDIFPQAEQAILDVSVAMHEDLQSATVQVGKALNDPITGMTALQRIGVTLSQSQKDLVKHFIDTGQTAKAQSVIIAELTKEFGGSAEAAGKTLPGKLAILNEKWDEAKEKVAGVIIPILSDLVDKYVMPLADWLGKQLPGAIQVTTNFLNNQLMPAINSLMNSPVVKTIEGWAQSIAQKLDPQLGDTGLTGHANTAKTAVKNIDNQMGTTTDKMAGRYATNVQKAIDKVDGLTTSLGGTVPTGKGLNPAIIRVNDNLDKMDAKLNASAKASQQAQKPTQFLGGVFDGLGRAIGGAGQAIGSFVSDFQERFGPALPRIKKMLSDIQDDFSLFGEGIHNIWDGLWAVVSAPVRFAFEAIHTAMNVGFDLINGRLDLAGKDLQAGFGKLVGIVQDQWAGVGRIIVGLGQSILGWIVAPFKQAWKNTEQALGQFKDGITNWWTKTLLPAVQNAVSNFAHMIQDYINQHMPHFPGINIPGFGGNTPGRASGGPISGPFIGAERGPELLVTPGLYNAPPGSYVYNAQQTAAMLSGGTSTPVRGGNTYNLTTIQGATAEEIVRTLKRKEMLLAFQAR